MLDTTLAVFDHAAAAGEPLTTREVTDHLDCTRRTAYSRLQQLVDRGLLDTKKVGARGRIWWRDPSGTDDAADSGDTGRSPESTRQQRAREQERKRYEAAVETIGDGVYIVDEESRFVLVNDAHTELTGYDRSELLGAHASLVTTHDDLSLAERRSDELESGPNDVTTVETELVTKDGSRVPVQTRFALFPLGDGRSGRVGVVRDISERIAHERKLESRIRQQEAVTRLGRLALESRDLDRLMARAVDLVSETLDTAYCKVLDLDADAEELLLRQGVGWDDGIVGEATVSAVDDDSQAAHTLRTATPIIVENLAEETRFSGPSLLTDHDVVSGISTIIGTVEEPWGILGTHETDSRSFTEHDVNFVQSVAHILSTAINRHERERELARQREQLDALNDLSAVIRHITDAVIAQSTRDEIERAVCDRLGDAEAYQCAWVGEVDRSLDALTVTETAGCGDVEAEQLSLDRASAGGLTGMVDAAVQTQTVQVRRDVDPASAPGSPAAEASDGSSAPDEMTPAQFWRAVGDSDRQSFVAIPIVYEDLVFGVVTVATNRADAFERDERAIIDHLGELIGHAVVSLERKRALMSDEAIELRFRTEDLSTAFGTTAAIDGTISIDSTVAVEEGRHVAYGTVTDDALDALETIADAEPHWEELRTHPRDQGENAFEAVLSEPPVTSAVAAQGGEIVEARVADDSIHLGFRLPPGADVRAISDVVEETYPGVELTRREQVSRRDLGLDTALEAELTDRQRTALEASYRAGFFDWPRVSSGEVVAETLDISPSTYHQHLRAAERKVFERLFD